jgi:hypothetical protein
VAARTKSVLAGHGHRRLFDFQRSIPTVAGMVAAVHCALAADIVIRVDLSRSQRPALFAVPRDQTQK